MDVIAEINRRYNQTFTPESRFYRWTSALAIKDFQEDTFFVEGYEHSNASVDDFYRKPIRRNLRSTDLEHPGLGVTDCPAADFRVHGPLNIEMKLGDVLERGGKMYLYLSSGANCWYLTVPKGKKLPIQLEQGDPLLAKLGVVYNRIVGETDPSIKLHEWKQESTPFWLSTLYRKIGKNCERQPSLIEYSFDTDLLALRKKVIVEGTDEAMALGSVVSRILLKHPEISRIVIPRGWRTGVLEERLVEFGLEEKFRVDNFI